MSGRLGALALVYLAATSTTSITGVAAFSFVSPARRTLIAPQLQRARIMHHAPQPHFRAAPGPPPSGNHGHGHQGGGNHNGNHNGNRGPVATSASTHLTDHRFDALPLAPETHRALREVLGFSHMTQVQAATLPVILEGSDVIAKAKTGTGKTMVRVLEGGLR